MPEPLVLLPRSLFKSMLRVPGFDAEEGGSYAAHVWLQLKLRETNLEPALARRSLLKRLDLADFRDVEALTVAARRLHAYDHLAIEVLTRADPLEVLDEYGVEYSFN